MVEDLKYYLHLYLLCPLRFHRFEYVLGNNLWRTCWWCGKDEV